MSSIRLVFEVICCRECKCEGCVGGSIEYSTVEIGVLCAGSRVVCEKGKVCAFGWVGTDGLDEDC